MATITYFRGDAWRKPFSLLIAVILAGPQAVQAQTANDVVSAFHAANSGDVVIVKSGNYGPIALGPKEFSPPVTLRFENDAIVQKLRLRNVAGVIFENLIITAGKSARPISETAVFVQGGGDITFRRSRFAWASDGDPLNDGSALAFDGVDGARVEASFFSDVREGVIVRSSKNVEISESSFKDIFEDAIVISGSSHVVVRENICTNFRQVNGVKAHPDCIQLQAGSRAVANTDVLVAKNTILKGEGDRAQGVFISSRFAGEPHRNVTIENNFVQQSAPLGLFAYNVEGLVIRGNEIVPSFDAVEAPRILVRDPSENVVIENNTASRIRAPDHATVQNNTILD